MAPDNIGFGGRAQVRGTPTWGWPQRHAHSARRRAQRSAELEGEEALDIGICLMHNDMYENNTNY